MHPMTLYDAAVLEHQHATRQRARDHVVALRRRERAARLTRGARPTAATAARPATA